MEHKFAQQLKKGVLEMMVLQCLARQPSHGYGLIVSLREASDGLLVLKEGTLYPILYRLEDSGYIAASWQSPAAAPEGRPAARQVPRKIYAITEQGRALLEEELQIWGQFSACVTQLIAGQQKGEEHHGAGAGTVS